MLAAEVLSQLHRQGVTLTVAGGTITARPKSALTDEARRLIRSNKTELLSVLRDEARVRAWLAHIGETDPALIAEAMDQVRTDPAVRRWYLEHAAAIERPAFYERVLGNEAKSIATLEQEEIAEAVQIGLIPPAIAESNVVVVAYRSVSAQGLMAIPSSSYDGLKVLEAFAAGAS